MLQLLQGSGALLEAETAAICRQFADEAHNKKGMRVSAESITYTTEAPLVITNIDGLLEVLRHCSAWFVEVEAAMKNADPKTLLRWPIESAFYKAVVSKYSGDYPGTKLRSDLDVFDWL